MDEFHTSVLLHEVIDGLDIEVGKKYIDATLGGGGHGLEIVKRGGQVLGIDVDEEAIEYVKRIIGNWKFDPPKWRMKLVQGNFADIGEIAKENGFEKVAGILFDLGVSLHQLKTPERGFSFQKEGPLDMRMDPESGSAKAADLVNGLYEHELIELFEKYGGERMARAVARAICSARQVKRIETTGELAGVVERVKNRQGRIHPATQVFQALRIAVNDELGSLERALPQIAELLEERGKVAIISFHSLEDRIVKQFFKEKMHMVTKKPITASEAEIRMNPRARSAKLRIYEL